MPKKGKQLHKWIAWYRKHGIKGITLYSGCAINGVVIESNIQYGRHLLPYPQIGKIKIKRTIIDSLAEKPSRKWCYN